MSYTYSGTGCDRAGPFSLWCQQNQRRRQKGGRLRPRAQVPRGGPTAALTSLSTFFTVANVLVLISTDTPHISPGRVPPSGGRMKAVPKMAPEELDRLRGLARAAWARLHRGDLGSAEHAAAQEEYERARDDLHDAGYLIVIGADDLSPSTSTKTRARGQSAILTCSSRASMPDSPANSPPPTCTEFGNGPCICTKCT